MRGSYILDLHDVDRNVVFNAREIRTISALTFSEPRIPTIRITFKTGNPETFMYGNVTTRDADLVLIRKLKEVCDIE